MPGPVEKTKYFFSYTTASLALGCIRRSLGNTSTDEIMKEGKGRTHGELGSHDEWTERR